MTINNNAPVLMVKTQELRDYLISVNYLKSHMVASRHYDLEYQRTVAILAAELELANAQKREAT